MNQEFKQIISGLTVLNVYINGARLEFGGAHDIAVRGKTDPEPKFDFNREFLNHHGWRQDSSTGEDVCWYWDRK